MKELLEMIEQVDPADTAKMDEIDARVIEWLGTHDKITNKYGTWYLAKGWEQRMKEDKGEKGVNFDAKDFAENWIDITGYSQRTQKYTRSRDALKAIRPEGWLFGIDNSCHDSDVWFNSTAWNSKTSKWSGDMPTEELAELHAIIQAIEWERTNG